ncbi:hypothetical protein JXA59_00745 [Patescibacteria group bacterium]|nr:hypothetical protein [Patescibacteria group bacterium]
MTVGQARQIGSFVIDALKTVLNRFGFAMVQRMISDTNWVSDFKQKFVALFEALIPTNPYIDERVKRAWFYPKGWKSATIEEQKARLIKLFKRIDLSQVDALVAKVKAQKLADGLAVIPKLAYLAELWNITDPYGKGYGAMCEKLFELIAASRSFYNYRAGQMDEQHIRIMEDVREQLKKLEAETPGDVLVLSFNFGDLYAGFSPRNARFEALNNNQLPLITAQVACLLLTMPDRLTAYGQLFVDCSGDEWDWSADGDWTDSVYFAFDDGQLVFDDRRAGYPDDDCGTVVAFLGV